MHSMTMVEVAESVDEPVRGLTRREYDALIAAGHLVDEKVELLRGVMVEMASKGIPHEMAIQWLTMHLARRLPEHLHVRVQSAWAATDDSEPEPDLSIVPARLPLPPDGVRTHPQVAELIVEASDSSLRRDLGIKAEIYAEAGQRHYWVLDLRRREVVVHTDPVDGRYAHVERVGPPAVLETCGIAVPLAEWLAFAFGEG